MILNLKNKAKAKEIFNKIIDLGIDFKLKDRITEKNFDLANRKNLISNLPARGCSLDNLLEEFKRDILPYCTNFSSKNFMGFPDAGNSVASLGGAILYNFLQQNLINQSVCAPSATFLEMGVIRWLREAVGYKNREINDIWDVGGIITPGGTSSNTIGILLARENKFPNTMEKGVSDPEKSCLIVPKGIGHYSVKSGQMWVGCGNRLIEVKTKNFRYDLYDLKKKLKENRGKIMCLVAYAGDSRTMTVDNFDRLAVMVRKFDPSIWLHADACHGFSLGFSNKLRYKLKGIEKFDSISMDPHKVFATPYVISVLVVKDPQKMKSIISLSDLIMQEQFAFGQITPFLGSRSWNSLKLWFMMKNLGKIGLNNLINKRYSLAKYLEIKIKTDKDFILINDLDINSVVFLYVKGMDLTNIEEINEMNKNIHKTMMEEGLYHLHQFSIPDPGKLKKDSIIYPQRFMPGNPNTSKKDIDKMIKYVKMIGDKLAKNRQR